MSDRKPMLFAFADEAGGELSKQIAAMKRNGLMGVELRGTEYGNVSDLKPEQAKDINSRLQAEGLRVWSLGSPLGKTNITEPFGPVLEKLKRTLETAGTTRPSERASFMCRYLVLSFNISQAAAVSTEHWTKFAGSNMPKTPVFFKMSRQRSALSPYIPFSFSWHRVIPL